MADDADGDDLRYSDRPFTPSEWRRLRKYLHEIDEMAEVHRRMEPLVRSYEMASTLGRAGRIVAAWMIGTIIALLGIATALRELRWWPFGGGGGGG